ncbi:hypothetical protein BKA70DRAFT_1433559 [Coprinopsis sp. MPI-PUGE-AT-0042]|nr:hypothetical protein BKA70DRAFT_1433559 [Coprinopsis sp. MPI-PUGE-AT-0042]
MLLILICLRLATHGFRRATERAQGQQPGEKHPCLTQIAISELSVFEIHGYREFFFAHCVSFSTHDPSFTLDSAEDWIQNDALDLYRDLSGLSPHKGAVKTQEKLQTVSMKTLEAYRNFVVPQKFQSHPYFSVDSVENWFFDKPYDEWSGWVKEQAGLQRGEPRGRSRASSSASMVSVPRSSSVGTTSSRSASPPLSSCRRKWALF